MLRSITGKAGMKLCSRAVTQTMMKPMYISGVMEISFFAFLVFFAMFSPPFITKL